VETTEYRSTAHHRVPALDGLRGLAVLMVVVSHISSYHAELLGPAGVSIFFILSGYLITSLLLTEQDRWGKVSMSAFYARRALRLFPALLLVVVLTPLLLWSVDDPRLHSIATGLATSLFYVQDFASATAHFGVLPHAWSLSVEEQFYLIWPFVLGLILLRTRGDHRRIARIALVATAVAAIWHVLATVLVSYDWTYYAPDTNAVFLLAGCALATSLRAYPKLGVSRTVAAIALVAVCVLPLAFTRIPTADWRESTLLMFPVALAGGLLILGAPKLGVLNQPVLRWFGKISYSLYLWNYILISLEPNGRELTGKERGLAALAAIVVAAASWYLFEARILRLKRHFQRVSDATVDPETVGAPVVSPITPSGGLAGGGIQPAG
jgi:peptidoglycan/LPS O-acetylase OafA/YrhL